jgi:hypothetical protein
MLAGIWMGWGGLTSTPSGDGDRVCATRDAETARMSRNGRLDFMPAL